MITKQMIAFLAIGLVLGTLFTYGVTLTGFVPAVDAKTNAQGKSLAVKAENIAMDIAKTFEREGLTDISVVNIYEVKTSKTGIEKMVVYPVVLRGGDFDIALQERALGIFEQEFYAEVLAERVIVETDLIKARTILLASSQKGGATPCRGAIFMEVGDQVLKEGDLVGNAIQARVIQETVKAMQEAGYIASDSKVLMTSSALMNADGVPSDIHTYVLSIVDVEGTYDLTATRILESLLKSEFGAFENTLFVRAMNPYALLSQEAFYEACDASDLVEAKARLDIANSEIASYYGVGSTVFADGDPGPISQK